ncbi:MAG TPA: TetR/AcrR family transcriptional regulator C-terminal domain-containing protein [Acidimicrobiales bacterium]|nr:TetR/AcrR family transcriptional regulator C-terminal domain-containing protein [Acidimicrobiales bacterium]
MIEVALENVRGGRLETMTIRSLAADLGVAPMSLYRHIRSKDDLLDEVAEVLLKHAWRPPSRGKTWRNWIVEAANDLRQLLVDESCVLYVYLRHPVVTSTAIERMEAMIEVLRSAGLTPAKSRDAYAAIHTYTVGFAALEASRAGWHSDSNDELASQLAGFATAKQFDRGLVYLLDGIAAGL